MRLLGARLALLTFVATTILAACGRTDPPTDTAPQEATTTSEPTTTMAAPRGTLQVDHGPSDGQTFPTGPCANWQITLVNNSNTEIVSIRIVAKRVAYTNLRDYDPKTQSYPPDIPAALPKPTDVPLSLPAYGRQTIRFQVCTTTPPPADPNYAFGMYAPEKIGFTWATGQEGTTKF